LSPALSLISRYSLHIGIGSLLLLGLYVVIFLFVHALQPKVAPDVLDNDFKPGEVRPNEIDGLKYAWIRPPGEFQMGCNPAVDGPCQQGENSLQPVDLRYGFWLGTTEVTREAFRRFLESERRSFSVVMDWESPKQPMTMVLWAEADEFCRWSGGRLPAEAEWEYAARGEKGQRYPWGNEMPVNQKGMHNGAAFASRGPEEVGSFGANPFRLFDMAGNVYEWCNDTLYDTPQGMASDHWRVVRGGAWNKSEATLRTAHRFLVPAKKRQKNVGFRCAREKPPSHRLQ
jgi:formylglycine-generating enzyme required for sulfatase activity